MRGPIYPYVLLGTYIWAVTKNVWLLLTIIWSKKYLRLLFWGGFYSSAVTNTENTVHIHKVAACVAGSYVVHSLVTAVQCYCP